MNIINLIPDIIKVSFSKESHKNNLIICSDLNDIKKYDNVKKICYITNDININLDNYTKTNIENIYNHDFKMLFFTFNLENYLDQEEITFIIAGYESPITNETRIVCYSHGKFIQSTVDQHTEIDKENLINAEKNKYKVHRNMYNQMYNIYRVLDQVNTKYCIKNRSDEYYIDMDEYIDIMKNNNKLIINNLFFVGHDFYISDHLFGTNTHNFKNMILYLKDVLENKIIIEESFLSHTEKVFGVSYLNSKHTNINLRNNQKQTFIDNFYIYNCEKFYDYLVTTICLPLGSKILNVKYKSKPIIVQNKYRIYIKKNSGYTDIDKTDQNSNTIKELRKKLMNFTSIDDVKFES